MPTPLSSSEELILSIDSSVLPKFRRNKAIGTNEDLVGWHGNVVWVLDGASTPSRLIGSQPMHDAHWLVHQLDLLLRTRLMACPLEPLENLLAWCESQLDATIRSKYPLCENLDQLVPHTALGLMRIEADQVQTLLLQDISLVVIGDDQVSIHGDLRQAEFNQAFYLEQFELLRNGNTFQGSEYNQSLDNMVNRERQHRNAENGWWTFTGLTGAVRRATSLTLPRNSFQRYLLASDGAARFWSTFKFNPENLFGTDLGEVLSRVLEAENADADGRLYPRVGAFDDKAIVRVSC